jgi:hypothetical protein
MGNFVMFSTDEGARGGTERKTVACSELKSKIEKPITSDI